MRGFKGSFCENFVSPWGIHRWICRFCLHSCFEAIYHNLPITPGHDADVNSPLISLLKLSLAIPRMTRMLHSIDSCMNHPVCQYLDKILETYKHCQVIPSVFSCSKKGLRMIEIKKRMRWWAETQIDYSSTFLSRWTEWRQKSERKSYRRALTEKSSDEKLRFSVSFLSSRTHRLCTHYKKLFETVEHIGIHQITVLTSSQIINQSQMFHTTTGKSTGRGQNEIIYFQICFSLFPLFQSKLIFILCKYTL